MTITEPEREEVSANVEHATVAWAQRTSRLDLDRVDACARRAGTAPVDEPVDRGGRTLELTFDGAIAVVAHPSAHAEGTRLFPARVAKPHALHASAHDDADAHGRYT